MDRITQSKAFKTLLVFWLLQLVFSPSPTLNEMRQTIKQLEEETEIIQSVLQMRNFLDSESSCRTAEAKELYRRCKILYNLLNYYYRQIRHQDLEFQQKQKESLKIIQQSLHKLSDQNSDLSAPASTSSDYLSEANVNLDDFTTMPTISSFQSFRQQLRCLKELTENPKIGQVDIQGVKDKRLYLEYCYTIYLYLEDYLTSTGTLVGPQTPQDRCYRLPESDSCMKIIFQFIYDMLQFWINVSQKGRVVWSRSNRKIIGHWKLGITKRLQINRVQFSKTNKLMLNYGQKLRMLQQLLFELQSMQQQIIKQKAATAEAETEKGMKDKYAAELNKMEKGVALRITSFQKSVEQLAAKLRRLNIKTDIQHTIVESDTIHQVQKNCKALMWLFKDIPKDNYSEQTLKMQLFSTKHCQRYLRFLKQAHEKTTTIYIKQYLIEFITSMEKEIEMQKNQIERQHYNRQKNVFQVSQIKLNPPPQKSIN